MSKVISEASAGILDEVSKVFNDVIECYKFYYESDANK